jgi:hypothetical protein
MKHQDATAEWESQWMSQRQRDEILTERLELERARHTTGWRRNYFAFAVFVVVLAIAVAHHFA